MSGDPIAVGPWGGDGGGGWSWMADGDGIKQIILGHEEVIRSIKFLGGSGGFSNEFGSPSSSKIDQIQIAWPDEYLTSISGTFGRRWKNQNGHVVVRSIQFNTNARSYGPYGSTDGTAFSLPVKQGKIVGFHGRCGADLDSIGVYLKN
ncbi:PREDICTED: mannose/glucose-specific lectin-like [Nelumbo nucifera]|uniref:Jacalin-type lectin domain-containing protein n=2 Tax=Nelumbo nucifera TaxID=4432 RepID=A0A822ZJL3_NELNU|nr:PREDICTED: mannose/glucose-specific lectin-like [Nelumbo nucifera]DAD45312.1 TPA_asm: hypothetical protein HUJ06_003542 [Nelumbo nucifera]